MEVTREYLANYYMFVMVADGKEKITDEDLLQLNEDRLKASEVIMDNFMASRGLLLNPPDHSLGINGRVTNSEVREREED